MAKIHGVAYLIIGILIFFFSYYIKKGFALFIYVGLLMIIMGIIKLAAKSIKSKKTKKQLHPHYKQHQQAVYCSRCGATLRASDNFCYNCGNRRIYHHRR